MPVCKYLAKSQKSFPDIEDTLPSNFDALATKTNINSRSTTRYYLSIQDLWNQEHENRNRMFRLLSCLPESKMDVDQLGHVLFDMFQEDEDILEHANGNLRSDMKRLIRMYDYLKWGKK